jgi:CubicO group peptidase (beta-lactamase class C family)
MKKQILFVSSLLFILTACTPKSVEVKTSKTQAWEYADDSATGFDQQEIGQIYNFIVNDMNTTGAMVVRHGKVLAAYGDIDELSYLASCRKSILAILYGKYVLDGTIDLSLTLEDLGIDDIGGLLPIEKKATIENLITARSGVYHPASNGGDNLADAPERGSQTPGEYFLYNNWDFNAAGAIFEKLTGKNIYDEIEAQLAIPMGFEDWDRSAQRKSGNTERSVNQAYHIWLSTRDMAKIGQLMLQKGEWNGKQIIDKDWAKKIVSEVTPLEEMHPLSYRDGYFGYGYMWWLYQGPKTPKGFEGAYSARGAYGQYITVFPELDMVVSHKTKSDYGRRTDGNDYQKLLEMIVEAQLN